MSEQARCLGWRQEDESLLADKLAAIMQPLCSAPLRSDQIPADFIPSFLRCEDQGATNTCAAHAVTTAGEVCYHIASRGDDTQFSRRAAYAWSKEIDGSSPNHDQGATISAVALVSQRTGFCPEQIVPWYPAGRFVRGVPNEMAAKQEASKFRIGSLGDIRTYDQLDQWLTSGHGAVVCGIEWTTGWDELQGVEYLDHLPQGEYRGGHALAWCGWTNRAGERWPILVNSHGQRWGRNGLLAVNPRVVDTLARNSQFGFKGISDLSTPVVREWDWLTIQADSTPSTQGMW